MVLYKPRSKETLIITKAKVNMQQYPNSKMKYFTAVSPIWAKDVLTDLLREVLLFGKVAELGKVAVPE